MKQEPSISPIRYVLKHLRRDRARLAAAIFWSIFFVIVPMQIPILTGVLIDGIHLGKPSKIYGVIELPSTSPEQVVTFAVAGLVIIGALYGITAYFRTTSIARVSRHFVSELRKALVRKLEILSLDIHSKYGSGELLNRAIIDTQSLRTFIENSIIKTVVKVTEMAYPLFLLFMLDPFLAALSSSVLPAQWLITKRLQDKLHKASRQARTSQADLTTAIKENLDGIETIQTLNAEATSIKKISTLAEKVESDQVLAQKYSGMIMAIVWVLTGLGLSLVWWQGGLKVLAGQMTVGSLVTITGLVLFVYQPLRNFTRAINEYQRGIVAAERIQEILDADSSIRDSEDAARLNIQYGEIEFRNVSFAYSRSLSSLQETTTKDVNLRINQHSLTAIVGKSGSGKSTLLKLIARLYDPIEGQILIDGQNIQNVKLDSLRSQIAVVPQTPFILSGTVSENIRLAKPDATDEEVNKACRAADAAEFISKLERGFETRLGQGGINLSGGQAQRIAIARALIRRPKILLLDEPSSALDSESESAIMAVLYRLKSSVTIILVGHHLKAVNKSDRLIVVDNGRVVQDGTHKELISSEGLYSILYVEDVEDK